MADAGIESPAAGAPARPRSRVREFAFTAVLALILLLGAGEGAGFLLPLLAPFLLLWFLRVGWVAWRQPARRRAQAIKVGVVAALVLAAAMVQLHAQRQSQARAQKVVDAVLAWHAEHGGYPDNLAAVGMDDQALRRDWQVRYFNRAGQHQVLYTARFTPFDSYAYDFDKPGWRFVAE